jgi:hypothetical protein
MPSLAASIRAIGCPRCRVVLGCDRIEQFTRLMGAYRERVHRGEPVGELVDRPFGRARQRLDLRLEREMTTWNACPWFTDGPRPTAAELEAGVEPWGQLIRLLPDLRVMMLMGGDAQNGWRRARRRYPDLLPETGVKIICTYSPGPQALRHPDPAERARRQEDLKTAFHQAAAYSKI